MWVWFVAGAIAVPVIWYAVTIVVGANVSPEISGLALLKKEMIKQGVHPRSYDEECLKEIIGHLKIYADTMSKFMQDNFFNTFVEKIEHSALLIQGYEAGDLEGVWLGDPIIEILRKYKPITQKGDLL